MIQGVLVSPILQGFRDLFCIYNLGFFLPIMLYQEVFQEVMKTLIAKDAPQRRSLELVRALLVSEQLLKLAIKIVPLDF